MLAVCKPFDGSAASVGNGVMVALAASSAEQVAAIHAKALELGGTDEGAPGPRGDGGMDHRLFSRPGRQQAQRLPYGINP